MTLPIRAFLVGGVLAALSSPRAGAESFIESIPANSRLVFLGDSNTMDGRYVAYLDLLLRSRMAAEKFDVICLGLASETICGLSEMDHPWPRPCVQERIDRVLAKAEPTVVFLCYGMNDGIYHPFSDERFAKFQEAYRLVVGKVRATQAKVVILTPPPFDALSFDNQAALQPEGREGEYSYRKPFVKYDSVLEKYSAWLKQEKGLADLVIDVHTPLNQFLTEWRKTDPKYDSGDGIHPVAMLHWLMAREVALAIGIPTEVKSFSLEGPPDADGSYSFSAAVSIPLARDPAVPEAQWAAAGLNAAINRFQVTVPHPADYAYLIKDGDRILGSMTSAQLARGADLTRFPTLPPNAAAREALALALARHKLNSASWLDHVGHKRPDTPYQGPPWEKAREEVKAIEAELTILLAPREVKARLVPAKTKAEK